MQQNDTFSRRYTIPCHQTTDLCQAEFHYFHRITINKGQQMLSSNQYIVDNVVNLSTYFSLVTGSVDVLGAFFSIYTSFFLNLELYKFRYKSVQILL